jgi:hypothetical protein
MLRSDADSTQPPGELSDTRIIVGAYCRYWKGCPRPGRYPAGGEKVEPGVATRRGRCSPRTGAPAVGVPLILSRAVSAAQALTEGYRFGYITSR